MEEKRTLRILFIGNSHTYFNDMPAMVAEKARKAGFDCEVTMIAHGGWYLEQHVQEPDVRFNILYGHYDYVVLQEFSHPFGPEEKFFGAVRTLNQWIQEAKSKPVIYMTWARKEEKEVQPRMTAANKQIAEEIGALLAPVGLLTGEHGVKDWVEANYTVETDIEKLGDRMIERIEAKRAALGI